MKEAEAKAKKEAEAKAQREAEEIAQREAELARKTAELARREAELAKAKKEAEEKARREAEEKAMTEAKAKAKRDAEEKAKEAQEAEEWARQEAEAKARKAAEEKARQEAEEWARQEAEAKARKAAEAEAKREADDVARKDAEEVARKEAELARKEANASGQPTGTPMPSEPIGSFGTQLLGHLPTMFGVAQRKGHPSAASDAKAAGTPIPVYYSASNKRIMDTVLPQEAASARPMTAEEAAEYCPQGVASGFRAFLIPERAAESAGKLEVAGPQVSDDEEDPSGDFGVADRSAARRFNFRLW